MTEGKGRLVLAVQPLTFRPDIWRATDAADAIEIRSPREPRSPRTWKMKMKLSTGVILVEA